MLTSAHKGVAAEMAVVSDLTLSGGSVFTPVLPTSACDLIIEYMGRYYKVQVKSGYSKECRLSVDTRRPSAKDRAYSEDSYDILAMVDLTTRKVAYMNRFEITTDRFRFFFPGEIDARGKSTDYVPLFFADYIGFENVITRKLSAAS